MYVSPDGESIMEIPKDISAQDYKNCVVALKKSWSFKVSISFSMDSLNIKMCHIVLDNETT